VAKLISNGSQNNTADAVNYYLKSASMFVAKSQKVRQDWQSGEKSNADVSLDTVSRFF